MKEATEAATKVAIKRIMKLGCFAAAYTLKIQKSGLFCGGI